MQEHSELKVLMQRHIFGNDIANTFNPYSHAEFARRFEQHILPHRYVKIRHSGYLSHRGKTARLERLHQQMNLPPPMPKVTISTAHRVLLKTGIDITLCPVCKRGKLIYQKTMIMYNGILRDITTHHNRGSPRVTHQITHQIIQQITLSE